METISWTTLKKIVSRDNLASLMGGACLKVLFEGEPKFYVIIHPEQLMQTRIEALCSQIDASRGR